MTTAFKQSRYNIPPFEKGGLGGIFFELENK